VIYGPLLTRGERLVVVQEALAKADAEAKASFSRIDNGVRALYIVDALRAAEAVAKSRNDRPEGDSAT
jgi:hypothetical protein